MGDLSGYVYFFVQTNELVGRGLTKVGWATNPTRRLSAVQVCNPYLVEAWGLFPGSQVDEKHAHAVLAPYRVRGEWFALQGAVDEVYSASKDRWSLRMALASVVAQLEKEHAEVAVALGTPASEVR